MTAYSWHLALQPGGYRLDQSPRRSAGLLALDFLPRGAYTTMRTVGRTGILGWHQHLDRLEESTRLLDAPQQIDRAALGPLLCQLLQALPWPGESRVRLTLPSQGHPSLWLSIEPLVTPDEQAYEVGVAALVRPMARNNARAKDSAFIAQSAELRALYGGRINEVLMVDPDGQVLEGLGSNFFGVQNGTLRTAGPGVLAGITRSMVLEEAANEGIPVLLDPLPERALPGLDEAFISSSSRGILPLTEIEGHRVGDGTPGPITRRLMARYHTRMARETTDLCER